MFRRKNRLIADVITLKCSNCNSCVSACRRGVLDTAVVQGKTATFVNRPESCTGCGRCVRVCPEQAIELIARYC